MTPPRAAPAPIALATLAVLTLAACSEGEPSQPAAPGVEAATTVEDSAGIRIVTTAVTPETPHWRVPSQPELELGAVEGDAVYLFPLRGRSSSPPVPGGWSWAGGTWPSSGSWTPPASAS